MGMEYRTKGFGLTARAVVLVSAFLLVINFVLGFALVDQSRTVIKQLINARMLDVTNTAAAMIDGDALGAIQAEDAGTPEYQQIADTLNKFMGSIELEYIYGIRQVGERSFVFTIDADPDAPAPFGQEIACTDALYEASQGTAACDDVPYTDEWGRHYSAYSPAFDSNGNVSGMISADFSAEWYESAIASQTRTAVIIGLMSLVVGALVVLIVMMRLRKRFQALFQELTDLSEDVESLTREVTAPSALRAGEAGAQEGNAPVAGAPAIIASEDDIDALGMKIRAMQDELRAHIELVRAQAYTDALTGVGNKAAYDDELERLAEMIDRGEARFALAVFDVNGLKEANDRYGHDWGDRLITDAARAITSACGTGKAFRVGGDEFVAIFEGADEPGIDALFAEIDDAVQVANARWDDERPGLSLSKGAALFDADVDGDCEAVFRRADRMMYEDKAAYYRTHGDRRRHETPSFYVCERREES